MNAKKILSYAAGSIGSAVLGILTLPLMSWYFPAEDIGRIVLMQTAAGLGILVLGMGLDQAYIREYYAAADRDALFKTVLLPVVCITLPLAALLLFFPEMPSEILFSLSESHTGAGIILFALTLLLIRCPALILRMEERALAFSFSQLTPKLAVFALIAATAVLQLPANAATLVFIYLAANCAALALLVFQTRCRLKAAVRASVAPELLRRSLRYGIPLALGNLAYWGLTSVDRFFLKQYAGLEQLGIYSMGISFGAAALVFQNIFSTIWTPHIFRLVESGAPTAHLSDTAASASALVAAAVCLTGIASPLVLAVLPPQYAPVRFIVVSCMLPPLFYTLTEISGIGLNIVRQTRFITLANLTALSANLILLALLVPIAGARGAAVACACAFWLFFALKTECSSKLWQALKRTETYCHTLFCLVSASAYTYAGTSENYPYFAALWLVYLCLTARRHSSRLQTLFCRLKQKGNAS